MKNNKLLLGLTAVAALLGALILGKNISESVPPLAEVKQTTSVLLPEIPLNNRLNNATVMISNREKTSGGSGVIFYSSKDGSYILTNAHVCGILEGAGGLVSTNKGDVVVEEYVQSKIHDICAIKVLQNLGVNTKVADSAVYGEKIHVSGHPFLLPNTITDGYLSNTLEITLLIDVSECTEEEAENNLLMCFAFGGMPIIKNFTAQAVSAMAAPGNSGSGVYNDNGEIVGLLFAGIGRSVSHGLIVPLEYVKYFLSQEVFNLKWVMANSAKRGSELEKSKRSAKRTTSTLDLKKIKFPAVKSEKFEEAFNGLESLRKQQELQK